MTPAKSRSPGGCCPPRRPAAPLPAAGALRAGLQGGDAQGVASCRSHRHLGWLPVGPFTDRASSRASSKRQSRYSPAERRPSRPTACPGPLTCRPHAHAAGLSTAAGRGGTWSVRVGGQAAAAVAVAAERGFELAAVTGNDERLFLLRQGQEDALPGSCHGRRVSVRRLCLEGRCMRVGTARSFFGVPPFEASAKFAGRLRMNPGRTCRGRRIWRRSAKRYLCRAGVRA